jgi:alpha-glucuronidase
MVEFQITQEYLGQANGSVFLPALEHEVLNADTYARGEGSTVGRATDGSLFGHPISAIAGVSNIGEVPNWCGHHLLQANWYGFGRLAWNYQTSPGDIAREWLRQTFSRDAQFVEPMADIMIRSREAVVDYMMPLGLHFGGAWNHHYGPEPWCNVSGARPDWLPSYYHQARVDGIGFDRTSKGSNMVMQYFPPLRQLYNDVDTCDEKLLLWFHHVPWQYLMKSGKSLWDELCIHYQHGVEEIREFQKVWDRLRKFVDAERFAAVQRKLRLQENDAVWWRDACVLYFQTFSRLPIPYELERPINNLDELQQIHYPWTDHN